MDGINNKYFWFSDIARESVNWLWYPYIPFGKISVLQGDPGCGKSIMMMDIIAKVTTGGCLPDGRKQEALNVIYQCSEDGCKDTIKPRLERAGADCSRVAAINEDIFSLTLDDEMFRHAIIDLEARLLVIDPFQAYIGDSVISSATGMRKVMRNLGMWASAFNCAVVLVGHLNKRSGQKELYRGLGSVDIMAMARSVIQIERSSEEPGIRYLHHVKSSLASPGETLAFQIDSSATLHWVSIPCSDIMTDSVEYEDQFQLELLGGKTEMAARTIISMLSSGPMNANKVAQCISEQGISERTIKYAKKAIGIESFRKNGQWFWRLPTKDGKRPI